MPTLFISHASKDDARIKPFEDWLETNGIHDFFIDHASIVGGTSWREALRESAGSCRIVVCLVTVDWLRSDVCFGEFIAAYLMGKRLLPLFCLPESPSKALEERLREVRSESQGIDVVACCDGNGALCVDSVPETANQLRAALKEAGALARVGLDPGAFPLGQLEEGPFPGLRSFDDTDSDAAVFYGRSAEIASILEELRLMRAQSLRKPLMILGASGSGKSSILKAGVMPRLRRETPGWLPLRVFRPGGEPILNFAQSIAQTMLEFGREVPVGVIRDQLVAAAKQQGNGSGGESQGGSGSAVAACLEELGGKLREAAGRPDAAILIAIDQAEELLTADAESAMQFCEYLRAATATEKPWHIVFTVRTDSCRQLQSSALFNGLDARGIELRPLPRYRFESVITGPAGRYGVSVDEDLLEKLMEDSPGQDTLPLLAFALNRLWRQYAETGRLTLEHYKTIGGLRGLIRNAAEQALHGISPNANVPPPSRDPPDRVLKLARQTVVPALADINAQGAAVRRIADWSSFSEEARDLLGHFDAWRLVVRKLTPDGRDTVEITHEALFREWDRLANWLVPERERMDVLRAVKQSAQSWHRNARRTHWMDHRGRRLRQALELLRLPSYEQLLDSVDRAYLTGCRGRRRGRTIRRSLYAALTLVAVVFLSGAVDASMRQTEAGNGALFEFANLFRLDQDEPLTIESIQHRKKAASILSVAALPPADHWAPLQTPIIDCGGVQNIQVGPCVYAFAGHATYDPDELGATTQFAGWLNEGPGAFYRLTPNGDVSEWRGTGSVKRINRIEPNAQRWNIANAGIVALYPDQRIRAWHHAGAWPPQEISVPNIASHLIVTTPGLETVILADTAASLLFWSPGSGEEPQRVPAHRNSIQLVGIDKDGRKAISLGAEGTAKIWDVVDRKAVRTLSPEAGRYTTVAISRDGSLAMTLSNLGRIDLWDLEGNSPPRSISPTSGPITAFFLDAAPYIATINANGLIEIYDRDWKLLTRVQSIYPAIREISISPDARHLIVVSGPANTTQAVFYAYLFNLSPAQDPSEELPLVPSSAIPIAGNLAVEARATFFDDYKQIAVLDNYSGVATQRVDELTDLATDFATLRNDACDGGTAWILDDDIRDRIKGLKGLPRDICAWRGLGSLEGWRQQVNRWIYNFTGIDAYS